MATGVVGGRVNRFLLAAWAAYRRWRGRLSGVCFGHIPIKPSCFFFSRFFEDKVRLLGSFQRVAVYPY
jgi:hypothetical protein